jgi:hypothetical protein
MGTRSAPPGSFTLALQDAEVDTRGRSRAARVLPEGDMENTSGISSSDLVTRVQGPDVGPPLLSQWPTPLPSTLAALPRNQAPARAERDSVRTAERALWPALDGFRALLSLSWRPDTAYPGTVTPAKWVAGDPNGQCGVSSVWLAEMLSHKYSIRSTFCRGSLTFDGQAEDVGDHCWLEIQGESGELILDLTSDQAQGFNRQIVFESKASLDRKQVHYNSRERVEISDLPYSNPVWPRYQRLLLYMIMAMLAANEPGTR